MTASEMTWQYCCLLDIEKPTKAYQLLTAINLKDIAEHRQASMHYDISRVYTATGELEVAQVYAIQAIGKAVETKRLSLVPRFLALAKGIQQQNSYKLHAAHRRVRAQAQCTANEGFEDDQPCRSVTTEARDH